MASSLFNPCTRTVFFHNLSPSFLWFTSWPGTLHFILHTPNHCLLFATHALMITTCFAVVPRLCHLILVSLSTVYLEFYLVAASSNHSHLRPLKSHLIFLSYGPGLNSMQHTTSHTTTVQSSSYFQWYILIGKQWYQLPEFTKQMPLPLTISCSSKSRLVLPFWYLLTRVVPDRFQQSSKTVVCVFLVATSTLWIGKICCSSPYLHYLHCHHTAQNAQVKAFYFRLLKHYYVTITLLTVKCTLMEGYK